MPLNKTQLLRYLSAQRPRQPLAPQGARPTAGGPTAAEVEAAFQSLDGAFFFDRRQGGLAVNPAAQLTPRENRTIGQIVNGFRAKLQTGEIRIVRGAGGFFSVAGMEADREAWGLRPNPCTWRWWLRYRWWGVRLSLNHCAVEWLSGGAQAAAAAISAFGLPAWIGAMILAVAAAVLKLFDTGDGVRIYITWAGAWWMTSR